MDALSDDGAHGLTIIGFVGSVFSPYYASARKRGGADPLDHCAINVALYGKHRRWAMTERGRRHVERTAGLFRVGPSAMRWTAEGLMIDIDEVCMPLPFRMRGTVRVTPIHLHDQPVCLDGADRHFWRAVAPAGLVSVDLESPALSWSGKAYMDMNWGVEPLEAAFRDWTWLRTQEAGATTVLYDVTRRNGERFAFGRTFDGSAISDHALPGRTMLGKGLWGMTRPVLSEQPPELLGRLEDAPFYTRNHLAITLDGKSGEAVHESLSLDRFVHPVVQLMLPFRMPRRG